MSQPTKARIMVKIEDYTNWPITLEEKQIDALINELYERRNLFDKDVLLEILVEIGEREIYNLSTLTEIREERLLEIIITGINFKSDENIGLVTNIMFSFASDKIFDFLKGKLETLILSDGIKPEMYYSLKEYSETYNKDLD